jgi:hypothetical protein
MTEGKFMTVEKFHAQRRMFSIMPERFQARLQFAPEGDQRSHAEWLLSSYRITETCLRGYVDETGLYFYSTFDCRAVEGDRERIWPWLREIGEYLDLAIETPIHMGAVPGVIGERWRPAQTLGTFLSLGL